MQYYVIWIQVSKTVTTISGNGESGDTDGPLSDARFQEPQALAVGPWRPGLAACSEADNSAVDGARVADPTDAIPDATAEAAASHAAGGGAVPRPARVVYVADTLNNRIRVVIGDAVTTLAGCDGAPGFDDHAEGKRARFNNPRGIAVCPRGTVLVGDSGNHVIRMIGPGGDVSTLAGSGQASTHTMAMRADGAATPTGFWAPLPLFSPLFFFSLRKRCARSCPPFPPSPSVVQT